MEREFEGYRFRLVCRIEPERDANGGIREFMPQSRYRNVKSLPLSRHGSGPFCQFRIPADLAYAGVYVLTVDGSPTYVGECIYLSERFNARGYGTIHPRNCYEGGQSTNCRVNSLILGAARAGRTVELWFHETGDRKALEQGLVGRMQTPWNAHLRS